MPLSMCGNGAVCTVKKVGGNSAVRQHLNNLGFNVGTPVTVVSTLDGNLIVRVRDARVAIDRMMANRILV
ncbi:MAG: ferrous iron transport protein A [Treponemataceae bacterium]|nr:ferrous iron transport protein A [Treponemataceae bacterium]